jgi:lipoate-protein ligase A
LGGDAGGHADPFGPVRGGETRQIRSLITTSDSATVNEDLLDRYLGDPRPLYRLYEPEQICVVMGAGGKAEADVFAEQAEIDRVPVLRRRGGGGTVVLSPGQVVLALVTEVSSPFQNLAYFRAINHWFRLALRELGVAGVEDRGISDLALGGKKILGTSLYRRRKILFYQASLLVDNDLSLFDRYLRFPSRVPDYRGGRGHLDFCTNLRLAGHELSVQDVMESLEPVVKDQLFQLD